MINQSYVIKCSIKALAEQLETYIDIGNLPLDVCKKFGIIGSNRIGGQIQSPEAVEANENVLRENGQPVIGQRE